MAVLELLARPARARFVAADPAPGGGVFRVALSALGRVDEAIVVYDDVVGRFGKATESALREQVANALLKNAKPAPGLFPSEHIPTRRAAARARIGDS